MLDSFVAKTFSSAALRAHFFAAVKGEMMGVSHGTSVPLWCLYHVVVMILINICYS